MDYGHYKTLHKLRSSEFKFYYKTVLNYPLEQATYNYTCRLKYNALSKWHYKLYQPFTHSHSCVERYTYFFVLVYFKQQ